MTDSQENEDNTKYLSASVILDSVKKEYDIENERSKTLDNRVGIFISLAAALLALTSQAINIKLINIKDIDIMIEVFIYGLYLIISMIMPVSTIISIIFFVKITSTKKYTRLELEDFKSENYNKREPDLISYALIRAYADNIAINCKINDKKYDYYNKGIYFLITSIFIYIILMLLNLFLEMR